MWSGAGPRAYSHWLIKTHMRTEDLMCRERSDPLSEGLITHSHWVACSLSHTWLCACVLACVCVCEDSVVRVWLGVCRQASESEWDRSRLKSVAVRVQKCAFPTSERTISRWPFWVGWQTHTQTHMNTCMQIHAPSSCPKHVVQSAALSWELWGSNRLINFSLSLF